MSREKKGGIRKWSINKEQKWDETINQANKRESRDCGKIEIQKTFIRIATIQRAVGRTDESEPMGLPMEPAFKF